jgi:hypothetical protein
MRRTALALGCAAALGCATPSPRGPVPTTPGPGAIGAGTCADAPQLFLAELCAMGEPSLSVAGPETYRFVWVRPLHNPVAVRLARAGDGVAVVSIEADAHEPGNERRHEFTASDEAWRTLTQHLLAADFWNLPGDPGEGERGLDGADWIIEGRSHGVYHSVVRWEPQAGPFRAACEDFIKLSGLTLASEVR